MDTKRLIVIGAGGHGKMVIESARPAWPEILVCDDAAERLGTSILGLPIVGGQQWIEAQDKATIAVIVAVGVNAIRARLLDWLGTTAIEIVSVVHPSAVVSPSATLGAGVFVAPGAVIGSDARLARGAIVNTAASVDHDSVIGDCAHIGPGAHLCGNVSVGAQALIGVGASAAPGVVIGKQCTIGAGAAVVRNIADGATAIGVPARATG